MTMTITKSAALRAFALSALLVVGMSAEASADCGFSDGDAKAGDAVYHQTCVACHGDDGRGVVPGAPDFSKKGGVLSEPHAMLNDHIKNGFQAPGAPMAMPPKGGNPSLTDQDIANVHAYLHKRFGCG